MFRAGLFFFFALLVVQSVFSQEECTYKSGKTWQEIQFDGDCSTADVAVFTRSVTIEVDSNYAVPKAIRVEEKGRLALDGDVKSSLFNDEMLHIQSIGHLNLKNFVNFTSGGMIYHESLGATNVVSNSYLWFNGLRARLNNSGEFTNDGFLSVKGSGFTHFYNGETGVFQNTDTVLIEGENLVLVKNLGSISNEGHFYVGAYGKGIFVNTGEIKNAGLLSIGMYFWNVQLGTIHLSSEKSIIHVYAPKMLSAVEISGKGWVRVGSEFNNTGSDFNLHAAKISPSVGAGLSFDFPNNDYVVPHGSFYLYNTAKNDEIAHLGFLRNGVDISELTLVVDGTDIPKNKPLPIVVAMRVRGTFASITMKDGSALSDNLEINYEDHLVTITRK